MSSPFRVLSESQLQLAEAAKSLWMFIPTQVKASNSTLVGVDHASVASNLRFLGGWPSFPCSAAAAFRYPDKADSKSVQARLPQAHREY